MRQRLLRRAPDKESRTTFEYRPTQQDSKDSAEGTPSSTMMPRSSESKNQLTALQAANAGKLDARQVRTCNRHGHSFPAAIFDDSSSSSASGLISLSLIAAIWSRSGLTCRRTCEIGSGICPALSSMRETGFLNSIGQVTDRDLKISYESKHRPGHVKSGDLHSE